LNACSQKHDGTTKIANSTNFRHTTVRDAEGLEAATTWEHRALRFDDVLQLSVRDRRCGCCDGRCSLAGHLPGLGTRGDHKTVIVPRVPQSPQNALFSVPQHAWLVMRCGKKPTKEVVTGARVGAFGVLEGGHSRRSCVLQAPNCDCSALLLLRA